jgi:hypothetical protein
VDVEVFGEFRHGRVRRAQVRSCCLARFGYLSVNVEALVCVGGRREACSPEAVCWQLVL